MITNGTEITDKHGVVWVVRSWHWNKRTGPTVELAEQSGLEIWNRACPPPPADFEMRIRTIVIGAEFQTDAEIEAELKRVVHG